MTTMIGFMGLCLTLLTPFDLAFLIRLPGV